MSRWSPAHRPAPMQRLEDVVGEQLIPAKPRVLPGHVVGVNEHGLLAEGGRSAPQGVCQGALSAPAPSVDRHHQGTVGWTMPKHHRGNDGDRKRAPRAQVPLRAASFRPGGSRSGAPGSRLKPQCRWGLLHQPILRPSSRHRWSRTASSNAWGHASPSSSEACLAAGRNCRAHATWRAIAASRVQSSGGRPCRISS